MTSKAFLASVFLVSGIMAQAQIKTPRPSPTAEVKQQVGLTDITINYSRPGKKGRVIFGDLVPYGKMWRTGANMNTTVEFSTDATINGVALKKGKYALYTVPGEKTWDIIFYMDHNNGGLPKEWADSKVAAKTTVNAGKRTTALESFRISLENLNNGSAELVLEWDMTSVTVPFTVPTDEIAMKSIETTMKGPSTNDFAAAAQYYLEEGKDLDMAYRWINQAIDMQGGNAPFWLWRRKALIEAGLGKTADAINSATKSRDIAKEAGNDEYVKMNEASIKEWSKK